MKKKLARMRRAKRIRCKIVQLGMMRLTIHRTNNHIYAQIIDPNRSITITSASSLEKIIQKQVKNTGNINAAKMVGIYISKRAIKQGITKVACDRSGFKYHGRIAVLTQYARKTGLQI